MTENERIEALEALGDKMLVSMSPAGRIGKMIGVLIGLAIRTALITLVVCLIIHWLKPLG